MKKIIKILIPILLLFIFSVTACSKKEEAPEYKIKIISNMSELERDHFYVETPEGYISPFWGDTSFEPGGSMYEEHVAWFNDENWDMIPTIYKGECVVYRTIEEFDEKFTFIKYIDEGYTLGICNLAKTETGRYKFDAGIESTNLARNSDAYRTADLASVITLDAIDGEPVRENIVTVCGTVTGLEKDKEYITDLYVGTEHVNATLKADSRALREGQEHSSLDYEFIQKEIIRIKIPDYFKSGYYSVNGSGIFRYVNGNSYDEKTNFNEYNPDSKMMAEILNNPAKYKVDSSENIEFTTAGTYLISVEYDNDINENLLDGIKDIDDVPTPSIYINTGEDEIKYFTNKGNNIMEAEYEIKNAGEYPMEIKNMYGRTYSYDIIKVNESKTTSEAEEDASKISTDSIEK